MAEKQVSSSQPRRTGSLRDPDLTSGLENASCLPTTHHHSTKVVPSSHAQLQREKSQGTLRGKIGAHIYCHKLISSIELSQLERLFESFLFKSFHANLFEL